LVRKLRHGRWWSHEAWQIKQTKNNNQQNQGKTQIPQPDLRLTVRKTAKQTAKGARGQSPTRKNHKRFAKDTAVETHCVTQENKNMQQTN